MVSFAFSAGLRAASLYVDGTTGNDTRDGLSPGMAWRTIQRAADAVNPGDSVTIQPGVYYERVIVTRTGTAAQPIAFRAAGPGVIVSGAHPAIRAGQTVWTLENAAQQLYSTAHPTLTAEPATVLADDADLFPYITLAELQAFTLASANGSGKAAPGPQAGFAFAGGKLYVRLNPRYGSTNPAAHVIKVSPPRAGGFRGDAIQQPTDFNWSVQTTVPAYVVLDGFTCESPGFAGVWIQRGQVTVRNSLFLGCRTGVRGWADAENQPPPTQISADVIVQGCEFSQFPAWQDMLDVVAAAEVLSPAEQAALPAFFWWSRKSGARTSEIGLTTATGLRWKILGNYVHDTLDGLSFMALSWSDECEVAYNRFEKLIDNAVEAENHTQHLRVHHNFIRDVYEPFSYQPLGGPPYPASIWFYKNIVTITPEATAFWQKPILKWVPGCFKIKPSGSSFTGIGLDGLLCFNNTIHFPSGNLLTLNTLAAGVSTIRFSNNIVIAQALQTGVTAPTFAGTEFSRNLVAPSASGLPGPGSVFAGIGGLVLATPLAIGLQDFAAGRFALAPGSPAIGGGVLIPGVGDSSVDLGALPTATLFQRFDQWQFQFFYDQLFAPATSGAGADAEGDGLGNVLECLLARNPVSADSAGATIAALDPSGRLTLSFTRRSALPEDVIWTVEASDELAVWTSGAGVTETLTPTPAGLGLQTERVRDLTPMTSTERRFLRLRATPLDLPPGRVPINDPPLPIGTGDLVIDGFTDGGRSNGSEALDTAWFTVFPPNGGTAPTLSIVNDSAGLGSGNALFIDNVTNAAQLGAKSIIAGFVGTTLTNVGDRITLSFDFRLARVAANDARNAFRFGLNNSGGAPYTADSQYKSPGHPGYMASVAFGTLGAVPSFLKEGTEGNINSADVTTVGPFGAASLSLLVGEPKYSIALTLTKTASAVTARLQISGASGVLLLDREVTDPLPQTRFDEFHFSTSQNEADYYLDNVNLNVTPAGS